MMQYIQVSKNNIPCGFKEDKLDSFEKKIQAILNHLCRENLVHNDNNDNNNLKSDYQPSEIYATTTN